MGEKKETYKTRDQWKKLINSHLSADEFQDLCYDIIRNNGFSNTQFRGKGSDGGRDLKAEFVYSVGKEEKRDVCWFQAKKQKNGVNFKQFSDEVQAAEDSRIKRFFILSNHDTTPDCKDRIEKWNKNHRCEINDWSGTRFLDMLFELPNICKAYFSDENVPPLIDISFPSSSIQKSENLGKRFGVELSFNLDKQVNMNNPHEIADALKTSLVTMNGVDINVKALMYQKMSMFFFSLERIDDALMFLDKSLEITPKNIEALLNKGYILEKIDEVNESNACYDELLKFDRKNKFALNNKAHNLRRQGELQLALELIEKTLSIDPGFIVAINTKVEILKSLNRTEDALNFLEQKKEYLNKSLLLKQLKVDLYIQQLDLRKAFELNEEILKINPENLGAVNNRGVIFEKNSHFQHKKKYLELALNEFENVISKDKTKSYPLGWSNKTVVFLNSGNTKAAEEIIDIAYVFFPTNPYVLNKKGIILLTRKKPKEALKYLDKAVRLYVQGEFLLDRAEALLKLRQWKKAISDANRALSFNSESGRAWHIKSVASKRLHETNKARKFAKKAEEYVPKPISLLED